MSKNTEKSKISKKKNNQASQSEENSKKNKVSIKDQNTKDNIEYKNLIKTNKLLSDYFSPNIGLKNMNLTFRCLSCHKIPKIRINYPHFKVFVSCPKHRKSLSYQEFLEQGYNNDLVSVPCNKCGKSHNYKMRGSYNICLQCDKIFCPECSSGKIKCDAYKSLNSSNKKEKKNMYINNSEEQHSKNHVFIKLDNYDNKCHIHQDNQLSLYCLDCQTELCARCQEIHTKGHKIRTLSKYTVNSKFIEACFEKLKNERDNIDFVGKYLKIFSDKNKKEENYKKNLKNQIEQDKLSLEIKTRILNNYKDKKSNYNSIRNVKKLKYPWNISINPKELDKIKDKLEIYNYLNFYLVEGNLYEDPNSSNENNSQDDSDSSEDNMSYFTFPEKNENNKNRKENRKNICFINDYGMNEINEINNNNNNINNTSRNKKKKSQKKEKEKEKNIEENINIINNEKNNLKKNLTEMKNFMVEQDEITIECLLGLKNSNFALGLRSGDLNIYKNDLNKKNYARILRISEHKSGINSLFEMPNNILLTASSDRYLKKIKLSEDNKAYKVEYIFNFHTSSVYKGIKLKNKNILSCGINDYLILWKHNPKYNDEENEDNTTEIFTSNNNNINSDMYTTIQIVGAGQGITDIIEMKSANFVCASDILQFWNYYSLNITQENNEDNNDDLNFNNEIEFDKEDKEIKTYDKNNNNKSKIIYDSSESHMTEKIDKIINNNKNNNTNINNNNNKEIISKDENKIYINKNEYYEKKGFLELKTSSSNCLCKLNSKYLFVILSEENIGKVAIVDTKLIQCIKKISVSKFELTSISNFNDDSILISCTEKEDDSFVVYIKQYQISRIDGIRFVGQKSKKLNEYYIKPNEKNEKGKKVNPIDKMNYEYSKKIREQINCIEYTNGGLLICTGKIESPEICKVIGEIDLFI